MSWTAESVALEEIGVLGLGLGCAYSMVSIVGEACTDSETSGRKRSF